jgi:hypothetical protein
MASAATPTVAENIAEPARHPRQQFAETSCNEQGDCATASPKSTTGRTLVLHSWCSLEMATTGSLSYVSSRRQQNNRGSTLQILTPGCGRGSKFS